MRPYASLIIDSFREALASRVLWIVLVLIAVTLVALVPIGYEPVLTTTFSRDDIWSARRLVQQMVGSPDAAPRPAAAALFASLDASQQEQIRRAGDPNERIRASTIRDLLNDLAERESEWYDETLWANELRFRELRELEDAPPGTLSEAEEARRARLRIEAALPGAVSHRRTQSVMLSYAWLDLPEPLPFSPDQFRDIIDSIILPLVLDFFLGVLAVFVAILVTAPIIPSMFRSGALQLLLSKPVNRSMLFLAKYLGGCAFIVVCATPLVVGVWAILGTRLDIWNHRLLLAIPLFCFLFAFYYSVSAVAGLIWRNTIVSIAVTVLFWLTCFLFTVLHGFLYTFAALPNQVTRMLATEHGVHVLGTRGRWRWIDSEGTWRMIDRGTVFGQPIDLLGPIDLDHGRVATAVTTNGFRLGGGSVALQVVGTSEQVDTIEPARGAELPAGTRKIAAVAAGDCLAVTREGLYRLGGDEAAKDDQEAAAEPFANVLNLFGINTSEGFRSVEPAALEFDRWMSLDASRSADLLAVYSRGQLYELAWDDSTRKYVIVRTLGFDPGNSIPSATAVGRRSIVVIQREGPLRYVGLDRDEVKTVSLPDDIRPRSLAADPTSDRFAIRTSRGEVYRFDTATGSLAYIPFDDQGEVHAVHWSDDGALWIAHSTDTLSLVDAKTGEVLKRHAPQLEGWRFAMHYFIDPLYTIFPKPSDLGETMQSLVFENEEASIDPGDESLDSLVVPLDPWSPVISCGAFMTLVLLLGCFYISRQDF